MAILINNLPDNVTKAQLTNLVAKYGTIVKIFIFDTAGCATVEMESEAQEERAVVELNGVEFLGQTIELFKSSEFKGREGNGGPKLVGEPPRTDDGNGGPN